MNTHEWFVEHRQDFAARILDPDDERNFADHLARCVACRSAVADLERDLAWLPMGVAPVRPRPGFRWRATRAVFGPPPRNRWLVWLPVAAAAGLLVAAGVALRNGSARESVLTSELARSRQALAALGDSVAILRGTARVLQASIEMEKHQGGLLIFADSVTHRWNVVLHGLPPAPAGHAYQFWFICSDGMVKSVELKPLGSGPMFVTVGMPSGGGQVIGAALSVELSGSVGPGPKGKELAHLIL